MSKQLILKKEVSDNLNNTSEKPLLIPKKKKPAFTERSRLVSRFGLHFVNTRPVPTYITLSIQ